jgi:hypothetical protein
MTKKLVAAVLATLLLVAAGWSALAAMTSRSVVSEEEYAVYSAVLTSQVLGQIAQPPNLLLIRGRTEKHHVPIGAIPFMRSLLWYQFNPRLWWLHASLTAKSLREAPLSDQFETPYFHEVINATEGFDPGVRGLPYARFSRVGLTPSGNSALVFLSYYCGSLCGVGAYIFLRHDSTGWEVVEEWVVWVS